MSETYEVTDKQIEAISQTSYRLAQQQTEDRIVEMLEEKLPALAKDFYTSFDGNGPEFVRRVIKHVKGVQK